MNRLSRNYLIVTGAYWADTLTDGAIRMLVLLFFAQLGYSPLAVAMLFLLYELCGVLTNLFGGYLAARFGLRRTLHLGLSAQLIALGMLAFAPQELLVVPYVMAAQAFSGIAKDLTKLASKSAVKLIAGPTDSRLYRLVSLLTGSKNAMKGLGFFVGALLLSLVGFQAALLVLAAIVLSALLTVLVLLRDELGSGRVRAPFTSIFARNRAVNLLAAARIFLFAARDVWFVVGLPVFFVSVLGWDFWLAGGFMAAWTIGYGAVQAATPALLRGRISHGQAPDGRSALGLALGLAGLPALIAAALGAGLPPQPVVVVGLLLFGVVFALNSAVHSYLILAYADDERVTRDVGFYYMANASGRLIGTLLSGLLSGLGLQYWGPLGGLSACLIASALLIAGAAVCSLPLPANRSTRAVSFGEAGE